MCAGITWLYTRYNGSQPSVFAWLILQTYSRTTARNWKSNPVQSEIRLNNNQKQSLPHSKHNDTISVRSDQMRHTVYWYCVDNMQNSSLLQQLVRIVTTLFYRADNRHLEHRITDILSTRKEQWKGRKKEREVDKRVACPQKRVKQFL